MIFFFDENISPKIATLIGAFDKDHETRHGSDFFRGMPDIEWIPKVAKWGDSAIITLDSRILTNKVERQVLRENGVHYIGLNKCWIRMAWPEQAWRIIKLWPSIRGAVLASRGNPKVFKVSQNKIQIEGVLKPL